MTDSRLPPSSRNVRARPARDPALLNLILGDWPGLVVALVALLLAVADVGHGLFAPGARSSDPIGIHAIAGAEAPAEVSSFERVLPDPHAAFSRVVQAHPEWGAAGDGPYLYEPRMVLALEGGGILLASAEARGAHAPATGSVGIFYLRSTPSGLELARAWPSVTIGAPLGRAPGFRVVETFGQWPVLVARARDVRSGVVCERTQLVELRATGPVKSDPFVSAYDARGAQGRSGRVWSGRMRDVGFRSGFTLVTGEGDIPFVRTDGRYAPADGHKSPRC